MPGRTVPLPRHKALTAARRPRTPGPSLTDAGETLARLHVTRRSQGGCESGCGRPASDWSHRRARSQGGLWMASNGIALCRACHAWAHANPALARLAGWHVPSWADPDTEPAWLAPARPDLRPGWYQLTPDGGYRPAVVDVPRPVLPWDLS